MVLYLFLSGVLLTHLRRPVSRMTVTEQQLEGEFRYVNSRLITNAEEVAFYKGNKREKVTMLTAFRRLVNHLRRFLEFRFTMSFVDNIVDPERLKELVVPEGARVVPLFYFTGGVWATLTTVARVIALML